MENYYNQLSVIWLLSNREIFHGNRWNESDIYRTVMVVHESQHIFLHNLITYMCTESDSDAMIGRVEKFFIDVSYSETSICITARSRLVQL